MCPSALHDFSVIIASSHAAKLLMGTIQYKQVDTRPPRSLCSTPDGFYFTPREVPAHTCSHHSKRHCWTFNVAVRQTLNLQVISTAERKRHRVAITKKAWLLSIQIFHFLCRIDKTRHQRALQSDEILRLRVVGPYHYVINNRVRRKRVHRPPLMAQNTYTINLSTPPPGAHPLHILLISIN